MFFRQFYLGCLAQASYLVGSKDEAAVVDPRRDVDEYIETAAANGMRIKYVIETHLHADFVSGHRELAERTGAPVVIAANANATFAHTAVADGDTIRLGDLVLRVIATPGHTPESICIAIEENGRTTRLLTGDTLFIGDVGRPDLAAGAGFTSEQMAELLFHSLHDKILRLPDEVEVWPAHGAGSLCGKNMSKETSSTIGMQRRVNYALRPMPKREFVAMMTRDLVEAPPYFPRDARINRDGARPLGSIGAPRPVTAVPEGAIVLDVRPAAVFGGAHIPRSLNIGLNGQFASWAGTLIEPEAELVLVGDHDDAIAEAVTRLARVGLENARAALHGGIDSWRRGGGAVARVPQISACETHEMQTAEPELQLIDVRRRGEFDGAHASGAISVPLHELRDRIEELDSARPAAVICGSGYRSSIATSILERHGFTRVFNVAGGTGAWLAAGLPSTSARS